jgi:hypothetical protein
MNFVKSRAWLCLALGFPAILQARSQNAITLAAIGQGSRVSLSQPRLDYGYVLVDTAGPSLVETVSNSGTEPLVIDAISVNGSSQEDFTPSYQFTLPVSVPPGGSVDISLSFTPHGPWKAGTRSAQLKLRDNAGVQEIPLSGIGATCAGPISACASHGLCADTDGDGLNDVWEDNGYIDLNNNGKDDPSDFHFPIAAKHHFSDVSFAGSGGVQMFPTVTDATLPIASSNVVVRVVMGGEIGVATFVYSVNAGPEVGPLIAAPVVDL